MTCDELYHRLTDQAEGALEDDLCAAVDQHLAECVACQQVRDDLRAIAQLCVEAEPVRLPDDVRHRIERLLVEDQPSAS
jgi:hypothetical protein